jgi:hypothetical protein
MSELNIPTIYLPILLQEICGPTLGIYKAAQFPEKEFFNGIFFAVRGQGDEKNLEIRTTKNLVLHFCTCPLVR